MKMKEIYINIRDLKACENRKVLKFDLKISKEKEDFIKDSEQ